VEEAVVYLTLSSLIYWINGMDLLLSAYPRQVFFEAVALLIVGDRENI
jgi:hypothetical protein